MKERSRDFVIQHENSQVDRVFERLSTFEDACGALERLSLTPTQLIAKKYFLAFGQN